MTYNNITRWVCSTELWNQLIPQKWFPGREINECREYSPKLKKSVQYYTNLIGGGFVYPQNVWNSATRCNEYVEIIFTRRRGLDEKPMSITRCTSRFTADISTAGLELNNMQSIQMKYSHFLLCTSSGIYKIYVYHTLLYLSGKWPWTFKLVWKPSRPIGDHPLADTLFFTHTCSMEVQTFTTDRGPPTLAMSIASASSK